MDERGKDPLRLPEPLMERLDRERRGRRFSTPLVTVTLVVFFIAVVGIATWHILFGGSCVAADLIAVAMVGIALYAFVAPANPRKMLAMFAAAPAADGEVPTTRDALDDMRIAFGLPRPPLLCVIDTPAVNALVSGRRLDDAAVAVTRGLTDTLDRDEQRAVLAHLFASQLIGKAAVSEADGTLEEQADALAMQTLRDPQALLAALEQTRGRSTLLSTHTSGVVGAFFFAPAIPFDPGLGDGALDRRIARLRAVLGAEGAC